MRYFQVLCQLKEGSYARRLIETTGVLCHEYDMQVAAFLDEAEDMQKSYAHLNVISRNNYISKKDVWKIAEKSLAYWKIADELGIVEVYERALVDTSFFPYQGELQKLTRLMPCLEMKDLIIDHKKSVIEIEAQAKDKAACQKLADTTPWAGSLNAELNRIFEKKNNSAQAIDKCDQHRVIQPVHYMFDSADNHRIQAAISALVNAKLECGALCSKRVIEIDFDLFDSKEGSSFHTLKTSELLNDSLGFALSGNTVVLKYGKSETYGSYDLKAFKNFSKMLEILQPYVLDTLVILAINNRSKSLVTKVENMLDMPVVHLQAQAESNSCLTKESALKNYALKAKEDKISLDANLEKLLDAAKSNQNLTSGDAIYKTWRARTVADHTYKLEVDKFCERAANKSTETNAMQKLDELIGLKNVKAQIKQILASINMNKVKRSMGIEPESHTLHLAFKGLPGTGKTEVAKLYAEILKEAHVSPTGTLVVKNGASWDIDEGFEEARGGVLFIDEAYALAPCSGLITKLIANMENHRKEVVVILAGYKDHIDSLISTNPGFKSRIGFEIEFADYTTDELMEIFKLMCKKEGMLIQIDAENEIRNIINRAGRRSDQGNARFVRKLFEDACMNKDCRLNAIQEKRASYTFKKEEVITLTKQDVLGLSTDDIDKNAWDELMSLIGLQAVKNELKRIVTFNKLQKVRRSRGIKCAFVPMHMAFTGNPGCGKTEVARLVGKILRQEGILSVGDFKECGKSNLVSPMSGVSTAKVNKLFEQSIGGVIFIDEAYSLVSSLDGCEREAVSALIANMENHREDVVVIFAGYEHDMDKLFAANEGFASRLKTRLRFADYTPCEMVEIFELMANKRSFKLDKNVKSKLLKIFETAHKTKDFGNARYVRNLLDETLLAQSLRVASAINAGEEVSDTELQTLKTEDISLPKKILEKKNNHVGFAS